MAVNSVPLAHSHRSLARYEVLHACDSVRDIADVVDAQITVGIRPFLLSRVGDASPRPGLLEAWADVRSWRRLIEDYGSPASRTSLILHAHSFSAGMAAVRGGSAVVYDLRRFVEQSAGHQPSAWLDRSFRAAEQFVLSRSQAIVVHDAAARTGCIARGARPADVFTIPDPVATDNDLDPGWLRRSFGLSIEDVLVFSADCSSSLLQAIETARGSVPALRLITIEGRNTQPEVQSGLAGCMICLPARDLKQTIGSVDIVISSRSVEAALAMQTRRALLALDCAEMRDLTPEGRGCLWSTLAPADMARRLVHLAQSADFRKALGDSAFSHICETRSPERVGHMYEEVYRHARDKYLRGSKPHDQTGALVPARLAV